MGKSLPSPTRLKEFARVATKNLNSTNRSGPTLENRFFEPETTKSGGSPLSEVVSDCTKRWFQDTLKEGKAGKTPTLENRLFKQETSKSGGTRDDSEKLKLKMENPQIPNRMPLSEVVSDCAKRWFQDTLKEAKAGDINMQLVVGQMYFSGYGVTRDAQKGRAWITRASRKRSSAWRVSDKHPGYNASDSDSDELKDDVK